MTDYTKDDQARLVNPIQNKNDEQVEKSLRPTSFNELIGRDNEKKTIKVMIDSATKRKKALDHILFHGPPGLGKTSFAYVIAKELGVPMYNTNGSAIEKTGDLAAILTGLESNSVLFIDEIHRLKINVEEMLYSVMEDNVLDIVIGKGPSAKTLRIDIPPITIIAATTKISSISAPLRDRFGLNIRLDFYEYPVLQKMVFQKANILGVDIDTQSALEIAKRSRMTARIAIRILKRVRDFAVVYGSSTISIELVNEVLKHLRIDSYGLDELDRNILHAILENFDNKPVGLNTLSIAVSEDHNTIENVYEPFLIKMGLLKRTPKGRVVTQKGVELYNSGFGDFTF